MGDLYHEKRNLRGAMEKRRQEASEMLGPLALQAAGHNFLKEVRIGAGTTVAAYLPHRGEIDPQPLINDLNAKGCRIALPVVTGKHNDLTFRAYSPGDRLVLGYAEIPEPLARADAVSPDIFLVPLLAFDRQGYRLGYGGGFYDRTLGLARLCKNVQAIGLAFACQEIEKVPRGIHDEPLDAILTEKEFLRLSIA